jgi:regulator of sigma D
MHYTDQRKSIDRRSQGYSRLQTLLGARQHTLKLYAGLARHRPFSDSQNLYSELLSFSQAVVDYTASAHFQLYKKLTEGTENREAVKLIGDRLYPRIVRSTQKILAFSDDFGDNPKPNLDHLEAQLSEVGEVLAERIELEDQLLEALRYDRRAVSA